MNVLISAGIFLLGLAIGSFLNVLVLRFKTSSILGRSFCFSCGRTLRWHELIPVASFITLRGRCRACRAKISWQYPMVELLTGFAFLSLFNLGLEPAEFLFSAVFFSVLIFVAVYDWLHKNCTEDKILFIGELVLNDFLLPSEFHKELKPWIDRYEKETK